MTNVISAKVICDSISAVSGDRLTTFEIEVPRIVWAEYMTHRQLSRNAASSRAIPGKKMIEQLNGKPVRFGKNISGMQDGGEHDALVGGIYTPEQFWEIAKHSATGFAQAFADAGYHKQVYNRLTEPFQIIKAVTSATVWDNFFWLRNDEAADPTIAALAKMMWDAGNDSTPQMLKPGEWHLPYVTTDYIEFGGKQLQMFFETEEYCLSDGITLENAIKVSCARCAAVSYRNTDYNLEKCKQVYERLVGADKKHASALEHCATPMEPYIYEFAGPNACTTKHVNNPEKSHTWQEGISHADRNGNLWSGNFKGFIQHRKLIAGECYTK